jgi:transcriptional regulator with XRE-family HTH domain
VSFQQIQKYERGTNRISASVLFALATRAELPIDWFFDGLDPLAAAPTMPMAVQALMSMRGGAALALRMASLSPKPRRQVVALIGDFADPERLDQAS